MQRVGIKPASKETFSTTLSLERTSSTSKVAVMLSDIEELRLKKRMVWIESQKREEIAEGKKIYKYEERERWEDEGNYIRLFPRFSSPLSPPWPWHHPSHLVHSLTFVTLQRSTAPHDSHKKPQLAEYSPATRKASSETVDLVPPS